MYESTDIDESVIKRVEKKTKAHLNFLRTMYPILRKQRFKTGLTQHDIKVLSYLYFYMLDTYGAFSIKDSEVFFEAFEEIQLQTLLSCSKTVASRTN